MGSESKINKYRMKRNVHQSQIDRVSDFCKQNLENATLCELQTRYDALNKSFDSFCMAQETLEELDETEIIAPNRATCEELFYSLKPALTTALNKLQVTARPNMEPREQPNDMSPLKLVKLPMPTFAGNPLEWNSFFEAFTSLVVNNQKLDDVARFHYLRIALQKPALNRIDGLDVTAANYPKAIELLKERYGSIKLIAQEHIKMLFNLPQADKGSPSKLRALIDTATNNLQALATLGRPSAQWDDMMVYLILSRVDLATRDKWEDESPTTRLCTLDELLKFLERRCATMESISQFSSSTKSNQSKQSTILASQKQLFTPKSTSKISKKCSICSMTNHYISRCNRFQRMSPSDRLQSVTRLKLCTNCLWDTHTLEACSNNATCRECSQNHHTLLHYAITKSSNSTTKSNPTTSTPTPSTSIHATESSMVTANSINSTISPALHRLPSQSYVLLATALINVSNNNGCLVQCRALLDSCSTRHYISSSFANQLGLPKYNHESSFSGIGGILSKSNKWTAITVSSRINSYAVNLEAHILPKISTPLPHHFIDLRSWPLPKNIELADPTFYNPQNIDLLIGAEYYFEILTQGNITFDENLPALRNTLFGWIVSGKIDSTNSSHHCSVAVSEVENKRLELQLQRFWEIERHDSPTVGPSRIEQSCESFFRDTTTRDSTGRFIVRLPFHTDPSRLGNSYNTALKRFYNVERKLNRDQDLNIQYNQFMAEYQSLNHMSSVPQHEANQPAFYLPHHCVMKLDSTSTKLRVVFDGSMKSSTKLSLNDILMTGPTVQPDLFSVLVRFRLPTYVLKFVDVC